MSKVSMFPAIRGVQDHMSNWMSSLIQAQDGCLQMVAKGYDGQSPTRAAGTDRCAKSSDAIA